MIAARTTFQPGTTAKSHGFTLLELLLATAIFSIVIVAINTVFFAALNLRKRTAETLDESLPVNQTLALLRKDLQNTIAPGGTLAGHFRIGGPASALSSTTGGPMPAAPAIAASGDSLDFFTTTGSLKDYERGADIQEVNYQLMEALDPASALGQDLVRSVTRNLLSFTSPIPEQQRLLSNVDSLEFEFYDGMQWLSIWDTTLNEGVLPEAVRVRLQLAVDRSRDTGSREPYEMLVLLPKYASMTSTNETETAGGEE